MPIRAALPQDVPAIVGLVQDLAEFEKLAHECEITSEAMHNSLFGDSPAVFAHVATTEDDTVVGYAIWFLTFSTFLGRHGIYLEDLLVHPEHRGQGHAKALMKHLAQVADERGYGRFEWMALDWNQNAIDFYERLGAEAKRDWMLFRLTGDALSNAAR